jgi:nucleoid-associated protein YgaU
MVRSGDSLWRIVAAQLGGRSTPRQIAATWPRWYAVNRAVIGADPGLIRPGQLLHPPASPPGPK